MVIDSVAKHMQQMDLFGLQITQSIITHLMEVKKIEFILLLAC